MQERKVKLNIIIILRHALERFVFHAVPSQVAESRSDTPIPVYQAKSWGVRSRELKARSVLSNLRYCIGGRFPYSPSRVLHAQIS